MELTHLDLNNDNNDNDLDIPMALIAISIGLNVLHVHPVFASVYVWLNLNFGIAEIINEDNLKVSLYSFQLITLVVSSIWKGVSFFKKKKNDDIQP